MNRGVIDMAQLHGSETEDYVRLLRTLTDKPLLQAFPHPFCAGLPGGGGPLGRLCAFGFRRRTAGV